MILEQVQHIPYIPSAENLAEWLIVTRGIVKPLQSWYLKHATKYVGITFKPVLLAHPAYKLFSFLLDLTCSIKLPKEK